MHSYFIYLAGGMTNLSFEQYTKWRRELKNQLENHIYSKFYSVNVIDPTEYFNFEVKRHESEKEVVEFDLHKVRTSNLIVVNFNAPQSLGTMAELAVAYEHRIPIIGLNEDNIEIHPWLEHFCSRTFKNKEELLNYVSDYYLN